MERQSIFNSMLFLISIFLLVEFIVYVKYNPSLKTAKITMDVSVLPSDEFVYVAVRIANTGSGPLKNATLSVYPPAGFGVIIDDEGSGHLDKYLVELPIDESTDYEFKLKHMSGVGKFTGSVILSTPEKVINEKRDFVMTISEKA